MRQQDPVPLQLLPYNGWDLTRREIRGETLVRTHIYHGRDLEYRFNSLGFRSEEYDPEAEFKIFSFGCSHSFGIGLQEDESWSSQFVERLCRLRGIDRSRVSFMNFSEPGASTDYIARILISQCSRIQPDLILVNLPSTNRTELVYGGHVFDLGEWMDSTVYIERLRERLQSQELKDSFDVAVARSKAFLEFSSPTQAAMSLIRNVLLIQYFCQARGIEAIASISEFRRLYDLTTENSEVFDPLMAAVHPDFVSDISIDAVPGASAYPDDLAHFHAETHATFAESMLDLFESRPRRGALGNARAQQESSPAPDLPLRAARPPRKESSLLKRFLGPKKTPSKNYDPNTYPLF